VLISLEFMASLAICRSGLDAGGEAKPNSTIRLNNGIYRRRDI
jgi:hypothetical protein